MMPATRRPLGRSMPLTALLGMTATTGLDRLIATEAAMVKTSCLTPLLAAATPHLIGLAAEGRPNHRGEPP